MLLLVVAIVAIGPFVSPDPFSQDLRSITQPPSAQHPAGTDQLGRDVMSRILNGGRYSFAISVASLLASVSAGGVLGLASGYVRNRLTHSVDAALDFLMAFPTMMIAILAAAILGNNFSSIVSAIGITLVPRFALVIRSHVLTVAHSGYIEAARVIGSGRARILRRHVLPNVMGSVIILVTLYFPLIVTLEASLSYLGLGVPADVPTWGRVIADGQPLFVIAPWIATAPGVLIVATCLAFNVLGDGLRDALDPRLRMP